MRDWSGWTGFAALLVVIVGAIEFFEGLIAVIRKHYYVPTPNQVISALAILALYGLTVRWRDNETATGG